jgi:hypothetical protein
MTSFDCRRMGLSRILLLHRSKMIHPSTAKSNQVKTLLKLSNMQQNVPYPPKKI